MPVDERDQRVLEALAAARAEHQELSSLLRFYQDLYQVQFRAKAEVPQLSIGAEETVSQRLESGVPQLTLEQLDLEAGSFGKLVGEIREILICHNPGWRVEAMDRAPEELVRLAGEVFDTWDTLTEPCAGAELEVGDEFHSDRLTALAVAFALAPFLQRVSDTILPRLDLGRWARGVCPICGGRPNFSLLDTESGARSLMCSRCDSLWPFSRILCPFCMSEERPVYYLSEHGLHRLYVCSACKNYLKAADLRKARRAVHPVVERLLTVNMDLAATREGFAG
jgi:FdhE protein